MQCYHSLSIMVSTERVTLSVVHLSPSAFWHLRFVQLIISPMKDILFDSSQTFETKMATCDHNAWNRHGLSILIQAIIVSIYMG